MKHLVATLFLSAAVLLSAQSSFAQSAEDHKQEEKEALKAAEAWLELMDSGKIKKAWEACLPFFQDNFPKESWVKSMDSSYAALGKLQERELFQANYYNQLPAAPPGKYVVIQFKSSYSKHDEKVTETVIPQKVDGEWKVTSFFFVK